MSFSPESDVFVFDWRIKNFSMTPRNKGRCIKSPEFTVDMLQSTVWYLEIFPRGRNNNDNIYCDLKRKVIGNQPENISLSIAFKVVGEEGALDSKAKPATIAWNGHFRKDMKRSMEEIESTYFPKDVFHLQCHMRKPTTIQLLGKWQLSDPGTFENAKAKPQQDHQRPSGFSVVTRIELDQRSLVWTIPGVTQLNSQQHILRVPTAGFYEPTLTVSAYIIENKLQFQIRRIPLDDSMYLKCRIATFSEELVVEGQQYFLTGHNDVCIMSSETLMWQEMAFLQEDTLQLNCEFTISYYYEINSSVRITYFSSEPSIQSGVDKLKPTSVRMFCNGDVMDVKINTGDQQFQTHANRLCAESQAFIPTFVGDSIVFTDVDIALLDPVMKENFLRFLQATMDSLKKMAMKDVLALYELASRCRVTNLKAKCGLFLKQGVQEKDVFAILRLADVLQDQKLMDIAADFLSNRTDILFRQNEMVSLEWKSIKEKMPKLATEFLLKVLEKHS